MVQFCAFDVLAVDGEDVRDLPLSMRKVNLDRLFRGRPDGIFINPFETGAIGPDLCRVACDMGLEGLVSKRSDRPYRGGRSPHWLKVKNRAHHAFDPVKQAVSCAATRSTRKAQRALAEYDRYGCVGLVVGPLKFPDATSSPLEKRDGSITKTKRRTTSRPAASQLSN